MKKNLTLIILFLLASRLLASEYSITRLEPPFWWTGMKNTSLQLLIYGPRISDLRPVINYPGIEITEVAEVTNLNYLFITLQINENVIPGKFDINFQKENKTKIKYAYQLLQREPGSAERQGFNNSDVIYLITPDRFANGNPANDNVEGYFEQANRADKSGRHGGDIQGVINHLDYIADMGFTALWLNPVLENNMPRTSYHGYAITDFYKVDPRFGTNDDYHQLSAKANERRIKLIMDMVANHCGSEHWWMKDLPSEDWFNGGGKYIRTNHRRSTVQDPYVSPSEKKMFPDGWFAESMPDMNQRNPLVARYLIQNTIWWIEYAGLGGIRQDTYSYPDKDFMTRWTCEVLDEYPNFNIVGEEWSENPAIVSYWQKGKVNRDGYASCLGSLMDFPLQSALVKGLNEDGAIYSNGFIKMYEMLANDFLYADPFNLVIFPDNHDMTRFYTQVHQDFSLFKMGIFYILTMRGTPQVYYGTEILMTSPGVKDDGLIRSDFPGGWKGDIVNAFDNTGLTVQQEEAKYFMRTLLNWRKDKTCLHDGKLIHYAPENGTYVYFRFNVDEMVMVVFNNNKNEVQLDANRFREVTGEHDHGTDVITGKSYLLDQLIIPARSVLILNL